MKVEVGRTYRRGEELIIGLTEYASVGRDGVRYMKSWDGWVDAEKTHSFEDLCTSWGITEEHFEAEINPIIRCFCGQVDKSDKGQRLKGEFSWDAFRTWTDKPRRHINRPGKTSGD